MGWVLNDSDSLSKFKSRYFSFIGKPANIYGSARSVRSSLSNPFSGFKIAVGDLPLRVEDSGFFHLWITNNTWFPLLWEKDHQKLVSKSNTPLMINVNCVNNLKSNERYSFIEQSLLNLTFNSDTNVIFYDSSHFDNLVLYNHRYMPCCRLRESLKIKQSIQELVGKEMGVGGLAYLCQHSLLQAIALALVLQCNPITLYGFDFPERMGDYKYFRNFFQPTLGMKNKLLLWYQQYFDPEMPTDFSGNFSKEIRTSVAMLKNLADSRQIRIIYNA